MLQEVKTGDKILAQQYNDLVKAVGGPMYASNETPFTRTSNGVVFNGGHTSYDTKSPAQTPVMLDVQYSSGNLLSGYAGYSASSDPSSRSDANRFNGVYLNCGAGTSFMMNCAWAPEYQGNATVPMLLIIDPTTQSPEIVPLDVRMMNSNPSGKWPLCLADEDAGYGIFQVVFPDNSSGTNGDVVIIAGNFTKLGANPSIGGANPFGADKENIIDALKTVNLYSDISDVRLLRQGPLWISKDWLRPNASVPRISYSVGQQVIVPMPDSYNIGMFNISQLSTNLSSLDYMPGEQVGFELYPTYTQQLFNFDKIEDEKKMWKDIYDTDPTSLSGWDILVRHKDKHPGQWEDADAQCSAYLDYVPLSGFLAVDSEMDAIKGEADTQCSSIQHNSTDSSLQIFKFDDPTTAVLEQDDFSDYDLVLRDNTGAMAKTNYYNLNSLFNELTSDITAVADVSVDSEVGNLSSIGWDANDALELYNFSQGQRVEKDDKFDIVVRDNEHNKINYTPLSALGSGYPGPWEITINKDTGDATFTNCVAKVARAYHFFADQTANVGGGDKMVYFVMTHTTSPAVHMYVGNYSSAASLLGGTDANCISASITPLYRVVDNEVACDFRYMMNIQAYDNRNFSTTMYY